MIRRTLTLLALVPAMLHAQEKGGKLPDVSSTVKGTLALPVPLGNPLFADITESVGLLDAVIQFPVWKGLSLGAGGRMSWFGIEERALAPLVTTGEVRRLAFYGKAAYERYIGPATFYELSGRAGLSSYAFDCPTCPDKPFNNLFHWGLGLGLYLHATDNLAFGLTVGYETDAHTFRSDDLGLESFPGRHEKVEARNFGAFVFGMGFSTRLRRAQDDARGW
jgi:hypothetical protein